MKLENLFNHRAPWIETEGPDSDVVISSRIRLARNINGYPFVNRASETEAQTILNKVQKASEKIFTPDTILFKELEDIPLLDRRLLFERRLVSKDLTEALHPAGVILDPTEEFSIMINEEDHIRMQRIKAGFQLRDLWTWIDDLDDKLEKNLSFAFDTKLGYLTACPSNVGTGIRVSVLLHIPGLVETGEVERVFRGLQKINLAVRGSYGEGSNPLGEFFQISNQTTLGRCEEELIDQLCNMVPRMIEYERRAREHLRESYYSRLLDKCCRALAILRTAHTISLEEAMEYLSSVRLGLYLNLIEKIPIVTLNEALLQCQPAHLMKRTGRILDEDEENIARADYFRKCFETV